MCLQELIKSKFCKYQGLTYIEKAESTNVFELSSEDYLFGTKNNEDNLNDKLNFESNLNKSEEKIEKNFINETKNNEYKIMNNNFSIISKKNLINSNSENTDKEKNNLSENKNSKKRGRKRKRSGLNENENQENNKDANCHDRYSDDNMRKKCKNIITKFALEFLNKKIKEKYNDEIGKGKFKKQLKILNQEEKVNTTVNLDKSFLLKNLKDIFSENISARFNNFPKNHNKLLIESLINEKDEEKKKFFIKLFNVTFLDCLKYFRGEETGIEELEGFETFSSIKDQLIEKNGNDYVDLLFFYLKNFKDIIDNKKPRNKKKVKGKKSHK